MDTLPELTSYRPLPPSRPLVVDISHWVERYSTMAALLATRFPHKAPELFAYMATIVRAERNYEPGRWVAYDRQFRREALAKKSLDWSVPEPRLYSEAFTGRARSIHGGRGLPAQGQQGRHHRSKARCLSHHGNPQRCAGASTRVAAV